MRLATTNHLKITSCLFFNLQGKSLLITQQISGLNDNNTVTFMHPSVPYLLYLGLDGG